MPGAPGHVPSLPSALNQALGKGKAQQRQSKAKAKAKANAIIGITNANGNARLAGDSVHSHLLLFGIGF